MSEEIAAIVSAQTAPRVTEASIKDHIVKVEYLNTDVLTIAVITMYNGFLVTGESACASPENYNKEVGEHYAFQDAFKKLWPLEGYLLKDRLFHQSLERANAADSPEESLEEARKRQDDNSHLRDAYRTHPL